MDNNNHTPTPIFTDCSWCTGPSDPNQTHAHIGRLGVSSPCPLGCCESENCPLDLNPYYEENQP